MPKDPKPDIAWIKLQAGLLRVDVETAAVEAFHASYRRWVRLRVYETNSSALGSYGYQYIKLQMTLGGRRYDQSVLLHRLVKMAACGERLTPDQQVDHLDGDKANNAWHNLEIVDGAENLRRRDEREAALMARPDYDPWADPEEYAA